MSTATHLQRTNETVQESGNYVCAAGITKAFRKNDKFPVCPQSGNETTWRRADHQHKTGDRVTEAGAYRDADGQRIELQAGDSFPNCPKSGKSTTWMHA